jgi:hypothetical protein
VSTDAERRQRQINREHKEHPVEDVTPEEQAEIDRLAHARHRARLARAAYEKGDAPAPPTAHPGGPSP